MTSGDSISVLIIEDDDGDTYLYERTLSDDDRYEFELTVETHLEQGLVRLREEEFDVLLLDLGLPDSSGLGTLERALGVEASVPIVILTGLSNEEIGLKAIEMGAQEYLLKGQIDGPLLTRTIRYSMERARINQRLQESLSAKETLLKEVHHRVRNNLQMIGSMMGLQARKTDSEEVEKVLRNTRKRIKSIGMIHQKLMENTENQEIPLSEYVRDLVDQILSASGKDDLVDLTLQLEDLELPFNTVLYCGLIIQELVSNSLEHAFSPDAAGELYVGIESETETVCLEVRDSGPGWTAVQENSSTNSLGLDLIQDLVSHQLKGEIDTSQESGVRTTISFPRPDQTLENPTRNIESVGS